MTGAGAPPDVYIEYILCTQMYHCLPSELDQEDHRRIADHLACMDVEARYREHVEKSQSSRYKG